MEFGYFYFLLMPAPTISQELTTSKAACVKETMNITDEHSLKNEHSGWCLTLLELLLVMGTEQSGYLVSPGDACCHHSAFVRAALHRGEQFLHLLKLGK